MPTPKISDLQAPLQVVNGQLTPTDLKLDSASGEIVYPTRNGIPFFKVKASFHLSVAQQNAIKKTIESYRVFNFSTLKVSRSGFSVQFADGRSNKAQTVAAQNLMVDLLRRFGSKNTPSFWYSGDNSEFSNNLSRSGSLHDLLRTGSNGIMH